MIFMKFLARKFANNRPENTGADRFTLIVQDDSGVAVKTNCGAVFTTDFFGGAHDNGLTDVALFHATARNGFLDRNDNDVSNTGVTTMGTTQNLDALNPASAGVISNIQIGLHLDHLVSPDLWGRPDFGPPGFRSD